MSQWTWGSGKPPAEWQWKLVSFLQSAASSLLSSGLLKLAANSHEWIPLTDESNISSHSYTASSHFVSLIPKRIQFCLCSKFSTQHPIMTTWGHPEKSHVHKCPQPLPDTLLCCLWSGFCLATPILLRWLSFWKLLPPGHFPDICSSNKTPAGSELLPPTVDGGNSAHWDLQRSRHLSVPFPRSVPPDNPVSDVYRQFLLLRAQFVPPHAPSTIGPSWRGGVGEQGTIPIHVQSTEFTTGWLQLSCRNISKDDPWKQEAPKRHGKGCKYLHTYDFLLFCF